MVFFAENFLFCVQVVLACFHLLVASVALEAVQVENVAGRSNDEIFRLEFFVAYPTFREHSSNITDRLEDELFKNERVIKKHGVHIGIINYISRIRRSVAISVSVIEDAKYLITILDISFYISLNCAQFGCDKENGEVNKQINKN